MSKIDLTKALKHLYNPSAKTVTVVDVPQMNFLMIDGAGDPNTAQDYREAVEALYALSYTLKFRVKKREGGMDYAVMPLEGLWWVEDMSQFSMDNKDAWEWTMMIAQPSQVSDSLVEAARWEVEQKKNPAALGKLRFETYHEGLSAQIMHIGPYSAEGPTVEKVHRFIESQGYKLRGKHHEIYLKDPRRSKPESLKTIIRQPVE